MQLFCSFLRWGLGLVEKLKSFWGYPVCMSSGLTGTPATPTAASPLTPTSSLGVLGDTVLKTRLVLQGLCRVINLCESLKGSIFGNSQGSLKYLKTTMFKPSQKERINRKKKLTSAVSLDHDEWLNNKGKDQFNSGRDATWMRVQTVSLELSVEMGVRRDKNPRCSEILPFATAWWTWGHNAKWGNSGRQRQILCDNAYLWNLTQDKTKRKQKKKQTKNL